MRGAVPWTCDDTWSTGRHVPRGLAVSSAWTRVAIGHVLQAHHGWIWQLQQPAQRAARVGAAGRTARGRLSLDRQADKQIVLVCADVLTL